MTTSAPPEAFAVFDQQDSGCSSYGIDLNGQRLVVKTAVTVAARESLGRAVVFHGAVRHPAIVSPIEVVDTKTPRQLVYPWVGGVVLNHAMTRGSDRAGLERTATQADVEHRFPCVERLTSAWLNTAASMRSWATGTTATRR